MSAGQDVRSALRRFVKSQNGGLNTYVAKVASVNEAEKTCDLSPLDDGPVIYGVRLKPDLGTDAGVYAIPKKGSYVLAVELGDENNVCILLVEKASKYVIMTDSGTIELNGNKYNVLRSDRVAERIKRLEDAFSGLQAKFNTHLHTLAGTPTTTPTVPSTENVNPSTTEAYLSNDKVKHG